MGELLNSIWETVFFGIFGGNFLFLMIALASLFWLIQHRRKSARQKESQSSYEEMVKSQKKTNISVQDVKATYGTASCYFGLNPDGTPRVINTGKYELKGKTKGFAWTLQSFIRLNAANYETRNSTYIFREDEVDMSLKLTMESVQFQSGEFLMIMSKPSMPATKKLSSLNGGGIFQKLLGFLYDTAASAALSFYSSGYFGEEGKKIRIKGAPSYVSQNTEFMDHFYSIASNVSFFEKIFSPDFERFLLEWRKQDLGFVRESAIDLHGLLFTDSGLTLGAQSAIIDPEKAGLLAEYAAEVSLHMKEIT